MPPKLSSPSFITTASTILDKRRHAGACRRSPEEARMTFYEILPCSAAPSDARARPCRFTAIKSFSSRCRRPCYLSAAARDTARWPTRASGDFSFHGTMPTARRQADAHLSAPMRPTPGQERAAYMAMRVTADYASTRPYFFDARRERHWLSGH